ncbi:MAG: phosphoglycerate kinase [bacterium]
MKIKSIREIKSVKNKRIIVRVDFNVPLKQETNNPEAVRKLADRYGAGKKQEIIKDDARIKAVLPTIKYLADKGAKVILISHLGDPLKNKELRIKKQQFSLTPVALKLEKLLGVKIRFIDDCIGKKIENRVKKMKEGEIVLLENLRFYAGEEKNDEIFAKNLAKLAQIYINEAFSVSHREHASVSAITKFLPSYAGFLLEKEVAVLTKVLKKPERLFLVIIGGAKISTKIKVIENLLERVDYLLLGGALVNNFFKAQGYNVGKSLIETDYIKVAQNLLTGPKKEKLVLPIDVLVAKKIEPSAEPLVRHLNEVKDDEIILDIGPETIRSFAYLIKEAKTILWNGPLGMFELPRFRNGSIMIARVIASRSQGQAYGIVGGGETIECLNQTKMAQYVDWISTGGGAMLEFLEGKILPGIKPLLK